MDRIDIIVDGDILLFVGNVLELRVSSVTLKTVSPAFNAMLGPHFAEGQALRNSNNTTPTALPLPEDDPASMKTLCLILHYRSDKLPPHQDPPGLLLELAKTADKYGCACEVKPMATAWFPAVDEETMLEHYLDTLPALYVLDDAKHFARLTSSLGAGPRVSKRRLRAYDGELREILEALRTKRRQIKKHIEDAMDEIVRSAACCLSAGSAVDINEQELYPDPQQPATHCTLDETTASAHIRSLTDTGLLEHCKHDTIGEMLAAVEDMSLPSVLPLSVSRQDEGIEIAHHQQVHELKVWAGKVFTGVCIDCVKGNGAPEKHCRFQHHKPLAGPPCDDD